MAVDPWAASLIAAGGGLAQAGGPSRYPVGFGQAFSQAANQGLGAYMQAQQMGQRERLNDLQMLEASLAMGQRQREEQARQKRAAALAKYVQGLDPQKAALIEAAPDAALAKMVESEFPDPVKPTDRYKVAGTDVIDMMAEGGPHIALRGSRDAGPLVPVFDDASGKTYYYTRSGQNTGMQAPPKDDNQLVQVVGDDGQIRYVPRSQAAGALAPPKSGMSVYDREGNLLVSTGPGGGGENLQKGTATEIEKKMVQLGDRMQRLDMISHSYKPEFSEVLPRAEMEWAALKDKFGALSPNERTALDEYTNWKSNAYEDLNRTLNELSGAAVTEHEMKRLTQASPKPGEGIFDGDSPTQFKSKLDAQRYQVKLAYARLHYYRTKGLPVPDFKNNDNGGVSLDKMPGIIDARGKELADEMQRRNPGATMDQINLAVDNQLRAEFGL